MDRVIESEAAMGDGGRNGSSISWLDFKLGFRMLAKYPGLTLVGGLAMSFAIWVGAGAFEFVRQVIHPALPLDDGDRIVGIWLWHTVASGVEEQALYDFVTWREELESITDLGAFRTLERNLIIEGGGAEPVEVAEISASAFSLARVPPLLGRTLVESDEQVGARAVVVIGHDLWQTRFAGDPDVVGQTVRLGTTESTVVGVMPEAFAFPVSHSLWAPLRVNDYGRRIGPAVEIFGRLAPGVTLDRAQAELTTLGLRAAAAFPDTHEHLRPQVMPYAQSIVTVSVGESLWLMSINLLLVMLLVGNVALLMFARAATREGEIVVRTALGASRMRIIAQLFVEALVLGGVAAIVGTAAAGFGLRWAMSMVEAEIGGGFPFWFDGDLSSATVIYAGVLTLLGAVIAVSCPRSVDARTAGPAP
ncbi:MAG: ABC transporter permease [Longimicrobiales bacterium]